MTVETVLDRPAHLYLPPRRRKPVSFRAYLLERAARTRTRRWLRRSPIDDLVTDFASDCELFPERVPHRDADLFAYLQKRAGWVELNTRPPTMDRWGAALPEPTAVEYLWERYLRARA